VIVGGLTVDRFEDGRAEAGGSVTHAARAAASRGMRVAVLTAAGPEPPARRGVAELRRLCPVVIVEDAPATATFEHREDATGRRLRLARAAPPVRLDANLTASLPSRAVLFAPIAGEVDHSTLRAGSAYAWRGAILQGWLRSTVEGAEVTPVPPHAVPAPLREALGTFDLLLASREDLNAGDAAGSAQQDLATLRAAFGRSPALVLTDGSRGAWISAAGSAAPMAHVAVPRVLEGVATVGAGDVLGAVLLVALSRGEPLETAVRNAMAAVVDFLEERRHPY
ncbi:MAG TPA: carbohydrate kinase family protein, partial [Candidatus Limnocylindria bacterium]